MDYFIKIKNLNPNILIIGDVMIDKYIYCNINRFSKEESIPILDVTNTEYCIGGAGNVCNNIVKLNYKATLCSVLGNDNEAKILLDLLKKNNIRTLIEYENRITTVKTRLYANKKQHCRYDNEIKNTINQDTEKKLFEKISNKISDFDTIIISDYDKGVITDSFCKNIIDLANNNDINCIIDSKTNNKNKLLNCTLYKPNRNEFEKLTNIVINKTTKEDLYFEIKKLAKLIKSYFIFLTFD